MSTLVCLSLLLTSAFAQDVEIVLDPTISDEGPDHVLVPFTVPAGTREIVVRHDDRSADTILDWGLDDPDGFRGWGGGLSEDTIVHEGAASRSYLAGPIQPGEWNVVIGKAKLATETVDPLLRVFLRDAPTLVDDRARGPYVPVPALETGARWYAGDFHVHGGQSGDTRIETEDAIAFARALGLDWIELSDHNTVSQIQLMGHHQAGLDDLLLLPGIEVTTYDGHANAIGATTWVNHRVGLDTTAQEMVDAIHDQGALVALNHPTLELGSLCIGCAWNQPIPAEAIDAIELITGGIDDPGGLFFLQTLAQWEGYLADGHHVVAIGGSDDHAAGTASGGLGSPIGNPTTYVYAEALSAEAIVEGVRRGHVAIKLGNGDDPLLVPWPAPPEGGDTVWARQANLTWRVTGAPIGAEVVVVQDGVPVGRHRVAADPFDVTVPIDAPPEGETRVRAQLDVDGQTRAITNHIYVRAPPPDTDAHSDDGGPDPAGCACIHGGASRGAGVWMLLSVLLLVHRRA